MQPGPDNVQTQPPDVAIEVQDEQAGETRQSVRMGSVHGEVHPPKFRNELKRLTSLRKVITSTQFWEVGIHSAYPVGNHINHQRLIACCRNAIAFWC